MVYLESYPCCGVERGKDHLPDCPEIRKAKALEKIADAAEDLVMQVSKP